MPHKRPKGIIVLGIFFIVTSTLHILVLTDIKNYYYLLQAWPGEFILPRLIISWITQLAGLGTGVGILYRKQWARKTACFLAIATVLVLYWKHPYSSFLQVTRDVNERFFNVSRFGCSLEHLALASCLLAYAIEAVWASAVIYYLTRSKVKKQFK